MKYLLNSLFDFSSAPTQGERFYYRFFEAFIIYWSIFFAWKWGIYIQKIGDVVLPLGIAQYLDIRFMFTGGVSLINAALLTVVLLIAFFRPNKYAYLVGLLLLHLQYVARFCLGEISHGSNVIGICLVGLAAAPFVFDNRDHILRFTLGFCYFFLGFGYTMAAICKLVATGPAWVKGNHLWMWISERAVDTFSMFGTIEYGFIQEWALDYWPIATLILAFGLTVEFFGFLFWFPRTRPYIATFLFAMHIGILLSMKINFPANNYILLVLGYPWYILLDRYQQKVIHPT